MAINQLKAGAFLSYISIVLHNIIGLLYTPFMLRMLGQSEYGLYSLVESVVAYLTILDLGFGNAIIRYTAKLRAERKEDEQWEMFGMFFLLYVVIGIVSFIAGLLLYFNIDNMFSNTMNEDEIYKINIMMLLMIFNIAFTFPMSIWGSIIMAYENFVFQKLVGIVRIILNPIVMIVLLLMGYKAIAMVVATTIFNVVTLFINFWYCKNKLHIRVRFGHFKLSFFKEVSIYSFWIFLNSIMDRIYWSTGQFVLGMFKGAAVVAIYAVAIRLQGIYMSLSTAISGVFLPKVTGMISRGKSEKDISDLFVRTGRIQYIVLAFILTGFIIFGKQFICMWAGADYTEAYWIALCFFIPLTVPLIQNLGITILQARNQLRFRSILYVIIALASLGISIPLARIYGGIGCAIGTSIALIAGQVIIMNIYYQKIIHLEIGRFWKEIGKMSISPCLLGIVSCLVIYHFEIDTVVKLIVGIISFSIVYWLVFWRFGMNKYERSLFTEPLHKLCRFFTRNDKY